MKLSLWLKVAKHNYFGLVVSYYLCVICSPFFCLPIFVLILFFFLTSWLYYQKTTAWIVRNFFISFMLFKWLCLPNISLMYFSQSRWLLSYSKPPSSYLQQPPNFREDTEFPFNLISKWTTVIFVQNQCNLKTPSRRLSCGLLFFTGKMTITLTPGSRIYYEIRQPQPPKHYCWWLLGTDHCPPSHIGDFVYFSFHKFLFLPPWNT